MSPIPENRVLPKKETDLFKSIVKFYERKDYKKGLKAADTVLKKFPNHGETLAMKGLTLNCVDKKEEAHDHVRRGLKADLRSHVCWHVFGLLHRSDRNYGEAIKCYLNALRIEPENMQILRDLANLQIQIREVKGFLETRRRILKLKSNLQANWMAYAVANHRMGEMKTAVEAIDAFIKSFKGEEEEKLDERYTTSELMMFKNQALSESGMFEEAFQHLDECKGKVMDALSWSLKKGEMALATGRFEVAEEMYRGLLKRGEDNYQIHRGLQCAVLQLPWTLSQEAMALGICDLPSGCLDGSGALDEGRLQKLKELYEGLKREFPKSSAVERIPLTFLRGEELRVPLALYMKRNIRHGVPSLGSDLCSLFVGREPGDSDNSCNVTGVAAGEGGEGGEGEGLGRPAPRVRDPVDLAADWKQQMVMGITESLVESLDKTGRFPPEEGEEDGGGSGEECLTMALFLRAQLEEKAGRLEEALATVERCMTRSPRSLDFPQRRGRILKKMGAIDEAARVMDEVREMDLADRYINSKATKYLLRAGKIKEAERTSALFTRHEGDPQHNLFEMQCSWFELEWAEAQVRAGKPGLALKKAYAVHSHYEDFVEDQFDFHSYCMRKV
ncbi:unnamed protein product, partial [Discosporangium mesarthrocarpum]